MSIAATAPTQASRADTATHQQPQDNQNPLIGLGFKVAEKFGLPVLILIMVLWWVRNDVVQPLMDAHFDFISKIVEGQKSHSEEVRGIGEKLERLIELTERK